MPMNNRLLRPRASGLHPEAADWRDRVIANGGTVSGPTLSAVSKFCRDIDAAGIRSRLYRLNLFCGTGLSACLVPLYRGQSRSGAQLGNTTDTNNNFVSGDYSETGTTGGLLGNGSTKYLNTGFNVNNLTASSVHLASYIRGTQNITSARTLLGVLFNGVTDRYRLFLSAINSTAPAFTISSELGKATQVGLANNPASTGGLILSSRTSTTSLSLYDDASLVASDSTSTAETVGASPIFVFARNGPTEFYNNYMAAYSIGSGMTSSEVAAYSVAMGAFQSALQRGA